MRPTTLLFCSAALSALALPALPAQERGMTDEMRREIRQLIRTEVRAAVREALREAHAGRGQTEHRTEYRTGHRDGHRAEHRDGHDGHGERHEVRWHGNVEVDLDDVMEKAHGAIARARGLSAEQRAKVEKALQHAKKARARSGSRHAEVFVEVEDDDGHGETRTFELPGGHGVVRLRRLGGDDPDAHEVDVRVQVETDRPDVHFGEEGKGKVFDVLHFGDHPSVFRWSKKKGEGKALSIPGGKGKVLFLRGGGGEDGGERHIEIHVEGDGAHFLHHGGEKHDKKHAGEHGEKHEKKTVVVRKGRRILL